MYERGGESGYDSYPKGTTHAPRCTHPNVIKWRISFNGPKSRCFKCVHLALGPDLHSGFLNGSPKVKFRRMSLVFSRLAVVPHIRSHHHLRGEFYIPTFGVHILTGDGSLLIEYSEQLVANGMGFLENPYSTINNGIAPDILSVVGVRLYPLLRSDGCTALSCI
ncbi:hypothetical protein FXO38_24305 [Capsicum annuum]|nr:hypothetical protein FXO38_24305 [Capsicum annuum]KAF3674008.1 hypothetical protein FXO37_06637 [Capsicum annuum]